MRGKSQNSKKGLDQFGMKRGAYIFKVLKYLPSSAKCSELTEIKREEVEEKGVYACAELPCHCHSTRTIFQLRSRLTTSPETCQKSK